MDLKINVARNRYPYCIVWSPIPLLTWFVPFIGHTGIAYSNGIIRDFSGSYFVSKDNMAFSNPTKYLQLDVNKVPDGELEWNKAVDYSSEIYSQRMHNLVWDNCHCHVALALSYMKYSNKDNYTMFDIFCKLLIYGKYVNFSGFLKTWLPFFITNSLILTLIFYFQK